MAFGPPIHPDPSLHRTEVMERVRRFLASEGADTTPDKRAAAAARPLARLMAQVFLTGGSGFIGGALCARLIEGGDAVRALARSPEAAEKVAARGADPFDGHVLDEDRLAAGMDGCDVAYHVAGREHPLPATTPTS